MSILGEKCLFHCEFTVLNHFDCNGTQIFRQKEETQAYRNSIWPNVRASIPIRRSVGAHGIFRAQNIIMLISVRIRRKMSIIIMNI